MRATILLVIALHAPILGASSAVAQIPMATGRSFTLSNVAWKVFIPNTYYQRPGSVADVLVHFHGDPQTYWNNAQYANLNAILVTVNYSGLSSAYSTPFSNSALFQQVLDEARTKVRQESDIPDNLQWDKLAVSSFSAGYGAVREILKSATYRNDIDALLAADSLYAMTAGDGTPLDSQMADYKTFAGLAKNGTKTFLFSHSQVPTFTYETTQECGDELMQFLGTSASAYNVNGLGTLNFYRSAQTGNFRLWARSARTATPTSSTFATSANSSKSCRSPSSCPATTTTAEWWTLPTTCSGETTKVRAHCRTRPASAPVRSTPPITTTGARASASKQLPVLVQVLASELPWQCRNPRRAHSLSAPVVEQRRRGAIGCTPLESQKGFHQPADRASANRASTSRSVVAQEHMNRAPPRPMNV